MRRDPPREKVLEALGVLALACLVLGHVAQRPAVKTGLLAAASLLLFVGLFVKPAAALIARAWLGLAEVLGALNSRILLTAIFYLFLTPLAVVARLVRGDVLLLKRRAGADRSYWQARDRVYTPEDIGKVW